MRNTSLARSSGRSAVLCVTVRAFFFIFLLCLPLPTSAQDFIPEKFDPALIEETLKDQAILREEMALDQVILREEMEQIRLEIQRIMKEIALSMKVEALKLKSELEELKEETQRIQKEIIATLEKSKHDFLEGKEEMQQEMQKMREEAKILTKEIKQILEDQKDVWQQETAALQDSLLEVRGEMNSAKVDSNEALLASRAASQKFKKEQVVIMTDSRSKSNAAMLDAGITLKESQEDYKQTSDNINKELMADIKDTQEEMQRRQKAQQKDSKNSQQEILAALKDAKKKRLAELKQGSTRKKLRKKKTIQPVKKQIQKKRPVKTVKKRRTLTAKAKVKTVDRQGAEKQTDERLSLEQPLPTVKAEPVIVAEVVAETPEEVLQKEVSRLSKNITNLKTELKKESGNPGTLLTKLGDAYLEAQHFMNSQNDKERQRLLDLSDTQDLLLGSYEQAAWAYKLSLDFTQKNAETHLKIGKIYDEMADGRNALMHAKLAHQILKRGDNSRRLKEAQTFIEMLTTKYENTSAKNNSIQKLTYLL